MAQHGSFRFDPIHRQHIQEMKHDGKNQAISLNTCEVSLSQVSELYNHWLEE